MLKIVNSKIRMIMPIALATVVPSLVSANDITLTSEEHGVTIAGEYAGFRENAYVVITEAGTLHVPAILVTCEGLDCLDIVKPALQDS